MSDPQPAPTTIGSASFRWGARTFVMGIINVTPDSFSGDGVLARDGDVAARRGGGTGAAHGRRGR